jgi:hypothetical protein
VARDIAAAAVIVIIFRFIVCFCFLFFGAIRAPLSGMDDWSNRGAVTDCLRKSSAAEKLPDYFVTTARRPLSLPLVWTGLA